MNIENNDEEMTCMLNAITDICSNCSSETIEVTIPTLSVYLVKNIMEKNNGNK